jgi:hypothetical protein
MNLAGIEKQLALYVRDRLGRTALVDVRIDDVPNGTVGVSIRVSDAGKQDVYRLSLQDVERMLDAELSNMATATVLVPALKLSFDQQGRTSLPPAYAEWVVALLAPRRTADALLGDLEEQFHRNRSTRGLRRARWLYRAQVLNSIAPLLWAAAKRIGVVALLGRMLGG